MNFITAKIAKVIIVAYVSKSAEQRRKQSTQDTRGSFVSRPRLLRCRDASRSCTYSRDTRSKKKLDGPGKNSEKNTESLRAIWKYLSSRRLPHLLFISFLLLLCCPLHFSLCLFSSSSSPLVRTYIHTRAYVKIRYTAQPLRSLSLPLSLSLSLSLSLILFLFSQDTLLVVFIDRLVRGKTGERRGTSQRRAPF